MERRLKCCDTAGFSCVTLIQDVVLQRLLGPEAFAQTAFCICHLHLLRYFRWCLSFRSSSNPWSVVPFTTSSMGGELSCKPPCYMFANGSYSGIQNALFLVSLEMSSILHQDFDKTAVNINIWRNRDGRSSKWLPFLEGASFLVPTTSTCYVSSVVEISETVAGYVQLEDRFLSNHH